MANANFVIVNRRTCFCNEQFDAKACSVQGIYKTSDVVANDPSSLSCTNSINVMSESPSSIFSPSLSHTF